MQPENQPVATPPPPNPIINTTTITSRPQPKVQLSGPSRLMLIISLLVFPPVGLALIWKNPRYFTWLYYLLWIYSILNIAWFTYILISIIPTIYNLYEGLGVPPPSYAETIIYIGYGYSLFSIVYGFLFRREILRAGTRVKTKAFMSIALLLISFFLSIVVQLVSIITPIYSVFGQVSF